MAKKSRFKRKFTYIIGEDFSKEEYDKWAAEMALWISQAHVNETDPIQKSLDILEAAMNGTKLNGDLWPGIESYTFDSRIKQLCGYDIIKGEGRKPGRPRKASDTGSGTIRQGKATNAARHKNGQRLEKINIQDLLEGREEFKNILYKEFPFLDNPVYENKVNAYADTVVKLDQLSDMFLGATGKDLETYLKIREALRKDLDDFMKMLKIHPSQIKDKVDEGDRGDVGNLIDKWEEYGEVSEIFEHVDAIQEAIQIIRQLENVRLDGSPQLAEWMLWHKTGCRGHKFVCECGAEYDLHGGFSKEEMYQIAEQAFEVFGYGIKRIDEENYNKERTETTEQTSEDVSEVPG